MIVEVLSLLKVVFLLSCLWGRNKEKISWQAERTSYDCLPHVKGVLSSLSVSCRSTWPSGISYSSWRRGIWSSCITCTVTASLWSCGSSWPPGSRARTGELPTTWYDIRDKELRTLEVCLIWTARYNVCLISFAYNQEETDVATGLFFCIVIYVYM